MKAGRETRDGRLLTWQMAFVIFPNLVGNHVRFITSNAGEDLHSRHPIFAEFLVELQTRRDIVLRGHVGQQDPEGCTVLYRHSASLGLV